MDTGSNKYKVIKADSGEWAKYHAIYRLSNFNEWMSISFENDIKRYTGDDSCYWVIENEERIGGAIIKSNMMKCIFIIPPFDNKKILIKTIFNFCKNISKDFIEIPDIENNFITYYKGLGFVLKSTNKLMICPTKKSKLIIDDRYKIMYPIKEYSNEITRLYYNSYSKSNLESIANQSYEFQEKSVDVYFKHIKALNISNEWSTLLYDKKHNKFVGACMVGLVNELPYILDFVVDTDYQNRGLAKFMMLRTLDIFYNEYPAIRLSVDVDNKATGFYSKLGFISLVSKSQMRNNL